MRVVRVWSGPRMRSISFARRPTLRATSGSFQNSGRVCFSSSSPSSRVSAGMSKIPPERGEALFETVGIESLQVGEYGLVGFFHGGG